VSVAQATIASPSPLAFQATRLCRVRPTRRTTATVSQSMARRVLLGLAPPRLRLAQPRAPRTHKRATRSGWTNKLSQQRAQPETLSRACVIRGGLPAFAAARVCSHPTEQNAKKRLVRRQDADAGRMLALGRKLQRSAKRSRPIASSQGMRRLRIRKQLRIVRTSAWSSPRFRARRTRLVLQPHWAELKPAGRGSAQRTLAAEGERGGSGRTAPPGLMQRRG
jgi:hypothetical protein